jgi:hypothetical protein
MQLSYTEAMLFVRFGEDMRANHWPQGHFVRLAPANTVLPGFVSKSYNPTPTDRNNFWSKA